jgi:hypothetical protein
MLKALTRAIELLEVYEGGPIEIGAPLHTAIAELEPYCVPQHDRMKHAHLFTPAHACWCRMLKCSRAGNVSGAKSECKKLLELLKG